jgi:hypothetical protein
MEWGKCNINLALSLFYSADGNYEVRYKSNVLIYPNGEVLWVPPAIYQVNLITEFEFISHICGTVLSFSIQFN